MLQPPKSGKVAAHTEVAAPASTVFVLNIILPSLSAQARLIHSSFVHMTPGIKSSDTIPSEAKRFVKPT